VTTVMMIVIIIRMIKITENIFALPDISAFFGFVGNIFDSTDDTKSEEKKDNLQCRCHQNSDDIEHFQ